MHYRAVKRLFWCILWICASATLLFGAFKYDLERVAEEGDADAAPLLFADHCGACHESGDVRVERQDDVFLLRFLDGHGSATRHEDRLIIDWLRARESDARLCLGLQAC